MREYKHQEIEKKWQDIWDEKQSFKAYNDYTKPKYYPLVEFPYPSGQGLHVGHPRPYTALDIVARKRRMEGYNVLYTMGWDAFGLPTENYAIKNKIHPAIVTEENVRRFKEQLKSLGLSFDWSREINTTDPNYYKWTQWIFIKLFENGLAYKKEMDINWCTSCKVGLANEEVVGGVCERCGSPVVKRAKSQWMLKITEYADRLIDDLDDLDYIERVKAQQKNWIGKSTGMEVDFTTTAGDALKVYTTRPDTIYGATYMVVSPDHPMIDERMSLIENYDALMAYRDEAKLKSDFERTELNKDKTGVEIKGIKAINPASEKEIPIFISDYVLMTYGTGAIMAVPGHDTRDWEFAKAYNLPIIEVVAGGNVEEEAYTDTDDGIIVNSPVIDGLAVAEAKEVIAKFLEDKGIGTKKVNFKLRDWVFSRQRYWGEPIPLVSCPECGWVAIPNSELPLTLPEVESYEPTDNGESPLAAMTDWIETTCPKCGGHAHRETDTMPQWAGSSWYFLRYCDPDNDQEFASMESLNYWMPVDWYNGGMEHTTLHLLYSRFWHKFLFDIGKVNTKEPYLKRTSHGMIMGENNEKMSKSRGNVVNPDEIIKESGADTLRLYEMFIGDFEKSVPWSDNSVKGCRRFLDRVWNMSQDVIEGESFSNELEITMNKTIKKVSEDYETLKFNTAIAAMMSLINDFKRVGHVNKAEYKALLLLLNPVAPHVSEELWEMMGFEGMITEQKWPVFNPDKVMEDVIEMAVQINGKVRGLISIPLDATAELARELALADEKIKLFTDGKTIVKEIFVPGKIFNIVVK
ncbi:leucine--tRNA ligase [Fusibacter bizertensis]|jgi:leucyl-tRNA synthetase, eubacterial and mitochondrial family|uniref:Leucine--tRNA ligase n=1 Tax=Fusibacter bizertensis TaxID=1488331 RepID=A0ABT6NA61_9FIRM|nr:leucine--tRNA ligase [Fusibacter bizertensis]MDH8677297.1 leucine--tRNA ligase [Fusibacter bizertensis]